MGKLLKQTDFGRIYENFYNTTDLKPNIKYGRRSLEEFMPFNDYKGKTFLDAGCGGGLFSLAANEIGFKSVASFDINHTMIKIANKQKEIFKLSNWAIYEGSMLDPAFMKSLSKYDYVYCWGATHHTGDMWAAISNISEKVNEDGYIYLGIYNEAKKFKFWCDGRLGSSVFWRIIKKFLNQLPSVFQNSITKLAQYTYKIQKKFMGYQFEPEDQRGMTEYVSMVDWLFGYPYQYAEPIEVINYMEQRGFKLIKSKTFEGLRTNHYLFHKNK